MTDVFHQESESLRIAAVHLINLMAFLVDIALNLRLTFHPINDKTSDHTREGLCSKHTGLQIAEA